MPGGALLLVEDHAVLRETLAIALRAEGYAVELARLFTAPAVTQAAANVRADAVLLDLDLGAGNDGLALVSPLSSAGYPVVIITGSQDEHVFGECLEAGALGIFTKSGHFTRLLDVVAVATRRGQVMSEAERVELLAKLRASRATAELEMRPFMTLTARERQILHLLIEGLSAEEMSALRNVTVATIRTQIQSILRKLEVNSQLAAVALARQVGWSDRSV